jgi:1-pyrroline-5-carboxylate dehydrogenase
MRHPHLFKEEISAVMVYEAGKPWDEAVGDAAEGIDFIEYYARSMILLRFLLYDV